MIICGKCGNQNQFGRVFCGTCGAKLDTTAMTSANVTDSNKDSWIRRHWPKIAGGVVLVIVLIVGMSFWPTPGKLGEEGKPAGVQRVRGNLEAMRTLRPGMSVGPVFKEADLNAYLATRVADLKVDSITVDIVPNVLHVRIVKSLFNIKLFGHELSPKVSYDVKLGAATGGYVFVRSGSKGHLSLGCKGAARSQLFGLVTTQKEWEGLRKTTGIKIEDGQVVLTVTGK